MSNYRKLIPALIGALAQVLTLLDQAVGEHALPASWVPWVQVAIAVATAAGVYGVKPNVPAAPPADRGSAGVALLAGLAVVLLLTAAAAPALASSRHAARPVVVPEVTRAIGGCAGDARTYLTVRTLVGDRGAWTASAAHAGVVVEGWFEGAWRRPTQAATPDGGILADAGWGRWRARLGSTTGPALEPKGDTCGVFGDAPHLVKAA